MEEFQNMLLKNKEMPKTTADGKPMPGKFELHKVERDSTGKERYIKTGEDDAYFKAKMQQMAADAMNELKGASFAERWKWTEAKKERGNELFKQGKVTEALDVYLMAMYGVEIGNKELSKEERSEIEQKLKVPVLNNLALCLSNQHHFERAIQMLDQVLKVDPKNEKALLRKSNALVESCEFDRAERLLRECEEVAF
mmetsp:Transcript_5468/g.9256  ORF Transcript_5468/g.9256 Transcript_5468/m.9256 type:complete len:197 (-) Transcript_5468:455-1045(-)